MPGAVCPIPGAYMDTQLDHTFADRVTAPKVTRLYLAQTDTNAGLGNLVPQAVHPSRKWLPAIVALVAENINHGGVIAYKLL